MNIDNKNKVEKLKKIIKNINQYKKIIKDLSNNELTQKTRKLKEIINYDEEKLYEFLPEAFAIVYEACKRVLNIEAFDTQLMCGIVMHEGNIAEMKTGEGKTLSAVFTAYLNALSGKSVHIITVNDYLAQRDKEQTEKVFNLLGLSVGVITSKSTVEERKKAYKCDILYGSNKEFGFDYLKDNLSKTKEGIVQRKLDFAIIDEADSVLIDEALLPLIISSSKTNVNPYCYAMANQFVRRLKGITVNKNKIKSKKYQKQLETYDYVFDLNTYTVYLTEKGIKKAEEDYKIKNFYDIKNVRNIHYVYEALVAHNLMKKDVDYIVQDGKVLVVDQNIGRVSKGKHFNNGLQQAIEAKEYVENTNEGQILATITFQNYFKMYKKIAGMTGTIMSAKREIENVYHLQCYEIPTNKPIKRIDKKMKVYSCNEARNEAILSEVKETYSKGQPVLIGASTIHTSETLSEMLKEEKIPHELLNAKNPKEEASIISKAGEEGKVTIATNMAGRGTDIKLGSNKVKQLGGLKVIGVELNDSQRIDNQLRGRSGRQGDIGESKFFISIEQDMIKPLVRKNKFDNERSLVKKCQNAQREIENRNYTARKAEIKFDDIVNLHRSIIYEQRRKILQTNKIERISKIIIEKLIEIYSTRDKLVIDKIEESFSKENMLENAFKKYNSNKKIFGNEFNLVQVEIMINAIDSNWKEHLNIMESLKEATRLKVYGRKNPMFEHQIESYKLFKELQNQIIEDIGMNILFATKLDQND